MTRGISFDKLGHFGAQGEGHFAGSLGSQVFPPNCDSPATSLDSGWWLKIGRCTKAVAQAAVAGLLDVFAGTGRVQSGRVNDPSRHYPGDVAVLAAETAEGGTDSYEKAFEVRDKAVRFSDVALFGRTCVDRGVRKAAMVLVSEVQPAIDHEEVQRWSDRLGVSMTIFLGWEAFAEACLFWASPPQPEAAALAVETRRSAQMADIYLAKDQRA
jgi:hypothetical protein